MTANIRSIYTKNIYIGSIYIINIWIRYIDIRNTYIRDINTKSAFDANIELKILIRLKVTLISLKINNCYFWLFIELIFALIDSMSYWNIKKLNLDLKNIYIFNIG